MALHISARALRPRRGRTSPAASAPAASRRTAPELAKHSVQSHARHRRPDRAGTRACGPPALPHHRSVHRADAPPASRTASRQGSPTPRPRSPAALLLRGRPAASIASTTSSPICGSPGPIARTSKSASTMPNITPAINCTARCLRSPNAAPNEITAAIDANAGLMLDPQQHRAVPRADRGHARLQNRPQMPMDPSTSQRMNRSVTLQTTPRHEAPLHPTELDHRVLTLPRARSARDRSPAASLGVADCSASGERRSDLPRSAHEP